MSLLLVWVSTRALLRNADTLKLSRPSPSERAGIDILENGAQLPWQTIHVRLAQKGFCMIQYPSTIELPHVLPNSAGGIGGIDSASRSVLIGACTNQDFDKRLSFRKETRGQYLC
jgi:hypothetical protein